MSATSLWNISVSSSRFNDDMAGYCLMFLLLVIIFFLRKDDFGMFMLCEYILSVLMIWFTRNVRVDDVSVPNKINVKDPPKVSPSTKRQALRKDRRKKRRSMDSRSSEGSPKGNMYSQQKTKFYRQLPEFTNLNKMSPSDLYFHFLKFVLTEQQLEENGFPRESPHHPNHILGKPKKQLRDKSLRHCVRCGDQFRILDDGEYSSETECYYHSKRITSLNGIPAAGRYLCCDGKFLAGGCTHNVHHVSSELFLDNIPFVTVRAKRQVRGGESCTVFGLDCEMSYTTAGLEVTKVGLVSIDGLTVYETFVKPENPVLDYNTEYSGVSAKDLEGITTTIKDVQEVLLRFLNKHSILVGHGLENDLEALRIVHKTIVDTSIVFPHKRGGKYKNSLKMLAEKYLGKAIQTDRKGHDPIEDARACMSLMLNKIRSERGLPLKHDENHNSYIQNDAYAADVCATPISSMSDFAPPRRSNSSLLSNSAQKQPRTQKLLRQCNFSPVYSQCPHSLRTENCPFKYYSRNGTWYPRTTYQCADSCSQGDSRTTYQCADSCSQGDSSAIPILMHPGFYAKENSFSAPIPNKQDNCCC